MPKTKPNEVHARVLAFLRTHPRSTSRQVGRHLWPDSLGWGRMSGGWSGCRGKMMPAKAGTLLHRMERLGLVLLEHDPHSRAGATPLWSARRG